ncbi:MAG: hypothetical protein FWF86_05995 [Clostridia bacterium]|nr:hypothetical protein [Clostridia bacterium]
MKINYEVKGSERKELAYAIGEAIGQVPVYAGMPTAAYHLVGGYTISRTGEFTAEGPVTDETNARIIARLGQLGYAGTIEDSDENVPAAETEGTPAHGDLTLTEREELGLGRERHEDFHGENGMMASDVPESSEGYETDRLTVEYPLDNMTPEAIDNLTKMVIAKEALIKAALGAEDLPIQMGEGTLLFPWFTLDDPGDAAYYVQFIFALCSTAKAKKRVTAKERGLTDNPKYAMRCFLLSLGMIGLEYRHSRKALCSKLPGNSAWKNGKKNEEVADDEISE